MFLQNFYQSRPFQALSAFLLCLVTLTGCSETAPRTLTEQKTSPISQGLTQYKLSAEEIQLGKTIIADPDTQILDEQAKSIHVRMKYALQTNRAGFKKAILDKDTEQLSKLLGFSSQEYTDFMAKSKQAVQRWNTKFGNKQDKITDISRKMGMLCKECHSLSALTANIDSILDRVEFFQKSGKTIKSGWFFIVFPHPLSASLQAPSPQWEREDIGTMRVRALLKEVC